MPQDTGLMNKTSGAPQSGISISVQGAFDPRMMDTLQGEAGGVAFEQSLKEMNMTPEEVMKKIMSDPELAVVSLQTCVSISSNSFSCC